MLPPLEAVTRTCAQCVAVIVSAALPACHYFRFRRVERDSFSGDPGAAVLRACLRRQCTQTITSHLRGQGQSLFTTSALVTMTASASWRASRGQVRGRAWWRRPSATSPCPTRAASSAGSSPGDFFLDTYIFWGKIFDERGNEGSFL